MVVCKFFLQGTCKFGDNCKFEHQIPSDRNYGNNSSILLQNYAQKPQQPTTQTVDTNTLIKVVINDMTAAEKGGQWLLSCYSPCKEKPAFPGFEDYSMEEVRYLFYEALKTGSIEQYKQNLQGMLQQAMMRIKALQNPSAEAVGVLKSIYDGSNPTTNPIFGGGQPPQQPVFPSATSQNIFASAQQNVFAAKPSIFGGQTSIFAQQQPVFQQQQQQTQPIFAQQQQHNSIFAAQQPPQNVFQQSAPVNPFGAQPAPQITAEDSPFGAPQDQKPAFQHSQSIFGNLVQQNIGQSVFGGAPEAKPSKDFYSKIEELTEEEIKWFQSDDLDIENIPEKPPTYEMCFKEG